MLSQKNLKGNCLGGREWKKSSYTSLSLRPTPLEKV